VVITNGNDLRTTVRKVDCIFYGFSARFDSDPEPILKHSVTIADENLNSIECPDITLAGDVVNFPAASGNVLKMAFISMLQGKAAAEGNPFKLPPGRSLISPFGKNWGASLLGLPLLGECCVGVAITKKLTAFKHGHEDKTMERYFSDK